MIPLPQGVGEDGDKFKRFSAVKVYDREVTDAANATFNRWKDIVDGKVRVDIVGALDERRRLLRNFWAAIAVMVAVAALAIWCIYAYSTGP
jgi:hypothetical protein